MISCKEYAEIKKAELKEKIAELGFTPKLVVIQVGDNPASNSYIAGKKKDCEEVGIKMEHFVYPEDISQDELAEETLFICSFPSTTGVIVQLPLPSHVNVKSIQHHIYKHKDVDGFRNDSPFDPCTPLGIINYLKYNNYEFEGKNALVIGRSDIVGKPLARMLTDLDCTVTLAHSKSCLTDALKHKDIAFTCIDKLEYFDAYGEFDDNTDIIDIGLGRNADGKLVGNLNAYTVELANNSMSRFGSFVISGPGGVGLLTRVALLENMYKAALLRKGDYDVCVPEEV